MSEGRITKNRMIRQPTLCMVHNTIGTQSSIAKIALWGVQQALNAGWQVTVVANDIDKSLLNDVEWLPLYVPPKAFLVQWLAARKTIQAALGTRKFDVLHVHQAQVAALADVMQCHFLTRVAYEQHCLESRKGLKPALARLQQQGVLYAEDYYYHHWNPSTRMLFCSELIQQEFHRLYESPKQESILVNFCPQIDFPAPETRRQARSRLIPNDFNGVVVGYLGGVDERKGYRRLLKGIERCKNTFLLFGGPGSKGFIPPAVTGRFYSVGVVQNLSEFFAACDVLVVPSYFDPCPVVVFEAASQGLPVIASRGVGNLPNLLEYEAGLAWEDDEPLEGLLQKSVDSRIEFQAGAVKMTASLAETSQGQKLIGIYNKVLQEKRGK